MKTVIKKYTINVLQGSWFLFSAPVKAQHMNMDFALRRNVLWYEQPWVWVTASLIFLVMLVWLLRHNDRNDNN